MSALEQKRPAGAGFDVNATLERVSHWLPTQGPLKDFIHHNTLHAFQHLPFHDGVEAAARLFGARRYLEDGWYRDLYRAGGIDDDAVERALAARFTSVDDRVWWKRRMLLEEPGSDVTPPPSNVRGNLRARWRERFGVELDVLVSPMLFRLVGNFLDQGIAVWRMPHADDRLWSAVQRLLRESSFPLPPLGDEIARECLRLEPEQAIENALARIVGNEAHYERYLLEMLLSHPGWSGIANMIATVPSSLLAARALPLRDFVALELTLELAWLTRKLGPAFAALAAEEAEPLPPPIDAVRAVPTTALLWQESLEQVYYRDLLGKLNRRVSPPAPKPAVQAAFCIDDREGGLREHLEAVDPEVTTFATAGFFGIDVMFQRAGEVYPIQHCPIVVKPRYLLRELPAGKAPKRPRLLQRLHGGGATNTLFRGWLTTQALGLWSSLRLAISVFFPGPGPATEAALSHVEIPTKLHLLREGDETTSDGLLVGYSIAEMCDRVESVLRSMGLTADFCDLVFLVAHGSSSVNNPHFAAYDCGACSGRPGAPNARAFAWMANHPAVRDEARRRGIDIPERCRFVGAVHDTSRDEVIYFDTESLPPSHAPLLERFRTAMVAALKHNAKERCRRFELASPTLTPAAALAHVRRRASSIFEPRPEMNHATNASAIVGRRSLTRGLSLDRRAFLNSYDPEKDPSGDILAGILGAVVPVCGGINLEYFFSRVDPSVYGAGTKLPHNVVGLVGVANGVDSDLRTGLPTQMTEIHDPVRLLVVVEQEPDVALRAATKIPAVFEWIANEWVRFACVSPGDRRVWTFEQGRFVEVSR